MNMSKLIKLAKSFEAKGWEQIGELEGLPLLRHSKSKTEAVIDDVTERLIPKSSFTKTIKLLEINYGKSITIRKTIN